MDLGAVCPQVRRGRVVSLPTRWQDYGPAGLPDKEAITMTALKSKRAFSLGKLYMTQGVMNGVPAMDIWHAVKRHAECDWGDVCEEDWKSKDASLKDDSRLLST